MTVVGGAWPLTQAQLGVLLGQQLAGDDSVFYAAECTELEGPFDPVLFEQAVHATLREATSLHRRIVKHEGGYEQQRIAPRLPALALQIVERHSDSDFTAELSAQLVRPFDPETGYLYDHRLYRRAPDRHVWLHRAHHLLLDGYGFQLIARRVAAHYGALVSGETAPPAVFGDLGPVVEADRTYQESPDRETDRQFWLDTLAGLSPKSLCPNTVTGIGRGRRIGGELPAPTVARLKACAQELNLTWPELLIAGFAAFLAVHGHGRDVVLGMINMMRHSGTLARTPCSVMNVMPLPVPNAERLSLAAIADAVRRDMPRLRRHQRYRFEHLEFDLERAGYPHGLLCTEINIMPFEPPSRFGPCRAYTRTLAAGPVEDLAAVFMARGDAIILDLDGRPENYDDVTLRIHWQRIAAFLARALDRPRAPVVDLAA